MHTRYLLIAVAGLLGCVPQASPPRSQPPSAPDMMTAVSKYLPLEKDTVLSFETEVEGSADRGLLVMQVRRPRPNLVELDIGGHAQRLDLVAEGVRVAEGAWILKGPLDMGATFQGQSGLVQITSLERKVTVPAGHFEDCLETVEQGAHARTRTVYCPGIGITELEVDGLSTAQPSRELARLKSRGPRIDVGKSGVTVLPPGYQDPQAPSTVEPPSP
jgi:hypothetical protein